MSTSSSSNRSCRGAIVALHAPRSTRSRSALWSPFRGVWGGVVPLIRTFPRCALVAPVGAPLSPPRRPSAAGARTATGREQGGPLRNARRATACLSSKIGNAASIHLS
eukprot:scaffold6068_cov119-Isochrysis_galbana.AAC.32